MKNILTDLSKIELELLGQVKELKGTIEIKIGQIKSLGLDCRYRDIFIKYNNFYAETESLEALKRSVFIQWYAVSEPLAFTGIGQLDDNLEKENLDIIRTLIILNKIDEEFKIMLAHYFTISRWYFDSFFKFSKLIEPVSINERLYVINRSFMKRGQMGNYWNSIFKK